MDSYEKDQYGRRTFKVSEQTLREQAESQDKRTPMPPPDQTNQKHENVGKAVKSPPIRRSLLQPDGERDEMLSKMKLEQAKVSQKEIIITETTS